MSSNVFRKVTLLLNKWPLDLSKKGRDIGEHIRQKVAISFPQGETSKVDVQEWTNFVEHLGNIANNKSLTNHPRMLKSSATGLSVEECKEIVSTDFISYVGRHERLRPVNPNKKEILEMEPEHYRHVATIDQHYKNN